MEAMDIFIAIFAAATCCVLSGARSLAYGLYFLSFVPFISLSPIEGGLTSTAGLGGDNVLFKLSLRALCTLGFLTLICRRRASLAHIFRTSSLPVVALVVWSLAWILRSQNPWISTFRLIELFSFFLAGVALYVDSAKRYDLRTVLRWHCLALWTLPLLALWFSVMRPDLAQHLDGAEITRLGHKLVNANSLGFASTIVLLWATSELRTAWKQPTKEPGQWKTRFLPIVPLLVCAWVLYMARSRTALATLTLGQVILWFPRGRLNLAHVRFAVLGLVIAAIGMWQGDLLQKWVLRGESVEALTSATGRTDLWTELLRDQVPQAPLGGAGYLMLSDEGGFWHAGRVWTNAHNTYLFALVSAGLVGLALVIMIVLLPWWNSLLLAWRLPEPQRSAATLLLALQTVLIATSITGFGVFGFPNPAMFFFYSLYAVVLAQRVPTSKFRLQHQSRSRPESAPERSPLQPSLP